MMSKIDHIIPKFLQGKASEEESQQLYSWIQQSPENKKRLFAEKDILDFEVFMSNQNGFDTIAELELLKKRIGNEKD